MPQADTIVPLVEERLIVDKDRVIDGHVSVSTRTEFVNEIAEVELERQQIEVSRVPFGIEVTEAPEIRTEGDVIIVPVLEERLVKRLFLIEEVHIRQQRSSEIITVPAVLRKQAATVERTQEINKEN